MAIGCLIIFSLAFIIFVIDFTTLGLLTNNIACLPFDVINNHEFWRLPFSFLFNYSFISYLLSYIFIHNLLAESENQQGTLMFIFCLILQNLLINISIIGTYILLNQIDFHVQYQPQNGVWNLFLLLCAKKCITQSNQTTRLFLLQFNTKNYYALLAILTIFIILIDSIGSIISVIFGLIIGLIFRNQICKFNIIKIFEKCLKCFITQNFIRHFETEQCQFEMLRLDYKTINNFFINNPEKIISNVLELGGVVKVQNNLPNIDKMLQYSSQQ